VNQRNTSAGAELAADLVRLKVDLIGYLTGWRRGEILTLTWADVDRDGGMIRLRPEHSKNRRGRALAIEGDLEALMERRWHARIVPGPAGTCRVADRVFHRQGRHIVDFRKAWAGACTAASVSGRLTKNP
jgi:integrase